MSLTLTADDLVLDFRRKDLAAKPSIFQAPAQTFLRTDRRRGLDGTMYVRGFRVNSIQEISHRLYEGFIPYEWLVKGGWRQGSDDTGEAHDIPEELWQTEHRMAEILHKGT